MATDAKRKSIRKGPSPLALPENVLVKWARRKLIMAALQRPAHSPWIFLARRYVAMMLRNPTVGGHSLKAWRVVYPKAEISL
nr:hypothetical protein [Pyrococcus yayanosii]